MSDRVFYTIVVEAEAAPVAPAIRLRQLLKVALYGFKLRCVEVSEKPLTDTIDSAPDAAGRTKKKKLITE